MSVDVKVTLKDWSKQVMSGVKEGNEKAILFMAQSIISKAKVIAPRKTGQLVNSISYVTSLNSGGATGGEEVIDIQAEPGVAFVGASAEHAIYQELGTQTLPPQPFMQPAIFAVTKGISTNTTIKKLINKDAEKKALQAGRNK